MLMASVGFGRVDMLGADNEHFILFVRWTEPLPQVGVAIGCDIIIITVYQSIDKG